MAVAFRSASSNNAAAASVTVAAPAGLQVGDLLLATAQGGTVTPPAGWSTANFRNRVFYKYATASEPTAYTFTTTGSSVAVAIAAYSGVDPNNPFTGSRTGTGPPGSVTTALGALSKAAATVAVVLLTGSGASVVPDTGSGTARAGDSAAGGGAAIRDTAWADTSTAGPSFGNTGGSVSVSYTTLGLNPDATVSFRESFASSLTGTNSSVTLPAISNGAAPSDALVLVAVSSLALSPTITGDTGWVNVYNGGSGSSFVGIWHKKVLPGDIAISMNQPIVSTAGGGAASMQAMILAYVGAGDIASSFPAVQAVSALAYSAATSWGWPSVTPATAPGALLAVEHVTSTTAPSSTDAALTSRATSTSLAAATIRAYGKSPYTATGATPAYTQTFGSAVTGQALLVVLNPGNVAPNAPTLTAPATGGAIDRTITNRFAWTFSDPNNLDVQSKFDLQYRLVGAGSWTTVTSTTANSYNDFAGGTFAAGSYEWQVRTYDRQGLVGPWSASSFFSAANPPSAPTITAPATGATIGVTPTTVTWTTAAQTALEARRVADVAGSPDTATVYATTGEVTNSAARGVSVTFPVNGRDEHVQIRIKNDGLWSPWADILVHVDYDQPPVPAVTVTADDATASIDVTWTTAAPGAGETAATTADLYRYDGTTAIRIATGLLPSATYTDYTPASGVDYSYEVVAFAANGTQTPSGWAGADTGVPDDDSQFLPGGSP